jgi:transketolase
VTVHEALVAADRLDGRGVSAQVLDVYSLKPIDREAVVSAARASGRVVVVEDHRPEGGLGDAVFAALAGSGVDTQVTHLAVSEIPGSATPTEQRAAAGIDADAITRAVRGDE